MLLTLGLCFVAPMLPSSGYKTLSYMLRMYIMVNMMKELDAITATKFYGPYQFRVLKDAVETKETKEDIDGRAFRTSDGVFMHVRARTIDNTSATLDMRLKNYCKDRTVPEPTAKMVLPIKYDVTEVDNDGVRSLLAEFMYGWPLHNRTDMVLVTDYEDTRSIIGCSFIETSYQMVFALSSCAR